jgi:hypothetical protein
MHEHIFKLLNILMFTDQKEFVIYVIRKNWVMNFTICLTLLFSKMKGKKLFLSIYILFQIQLVIMHEHIFKLLNILMFVGRQYINIRHIYLIAMQY